ncbi:MAG: diacylglycerol kinase family protein [Rhodovibrionaceae bacterium]|nr:diacylglycerol kinase family protein [Rhodovibrionaceae bacterium]
MTRICVISNPKSQQNRRRIERVRAALAEAAASAEHVEIGAIEEVPEIVASFARNGCDALVVNGGDGTVQAVMTELINSGMEARPPLAAVPAGMTNLIAADIGLGGEPEDVLARILARAASGDLQTARRAVMTLASDAKDPGVHGMFAGGGAFYDTVVWSRRKIHTLGAERNIAVGLALLTLGLRSLVGLTRGSPLATCTEMDIAFDGGEAERREVFVVRCTTLERLLMGMMPFWNGGKGDVRATVIDYPPRRLARALLPVARGRPRPWMEAAGYHSRRVRKISVACAKPIVFDGEFYDAERLGLPAGTPLVLEHRHDLDFVR